MLPPPLKVGLAGLGTVGASVVRLIERQREALEARCGRRIEVVAVTARAQAKQREIDIGRFRWVANPVKLAADPDIDVFVEVIGGESDPAKDAVETALAAGKSVVTANKALLARHGVALAALAEQKHVALNFEAAVAGGIPIVKTLREGLVGNSLARIYGILNGTCNYILTRMERENLSFARCLEEAQRLESGQARNLSQRQVESSGKAPLVLSCADPSNLQGKTADILQLSTELEDVILPRFHNQYRRILEGQIECARQEECLIAELIRNLGELYHRE